MWFVSVGATLPLLIMIPFVEHVTEVVKEKY